MPRARIDATAVALLTAAPLFWAGNAVVGRIAAGTIAPMALNALRWSAAAIVLLPFVWGGLRSHREVLLERWRSLVVLGILGTGSYNAFQYLALTTSTATNVTLIGASTPAFGLVLGALAFGEGPNRRGIAGAALSLLGVAVVLAHGDAMRLATMSVVPGDLFMVCGAVVWSLYTWLLRRHRPPVPGTVLLFAQIVPGLAFAAICAIVEWQVLHVPTHLDVERAWWILAYVAILPSIVAYACWDAGVRRSGAPFAMMFLNLSPVFAAVMSAALLAEWPQWYHGLGLALIVAGIALGR